MKRIIAFFAAFWALCGIFSINISAVEPTYSVSEKYKSSRYYGNLLSVEPTGDGASDVLAVAMSQLGYHEGDSDSQMDGMNTNGCRNFVEYNRLVGKVDNNEGNGVSYGYAWCAAFCNWCLHQAGIDGKLYSADGTKNYISCSLWVNALKKINVFRAAHGNYTPKSGDLIFFRDTDSVRVSTHVGFVLRVENQNIVTVEGNHDGCVGTHTYSADDGYIVGFGAINYEKTEDETAEATEAEGTATTADIIQTEPDTNEETTTDTPEEVTSESATEAPAETETGCKSTAAVGIVTAAAVWFASELKKNLKSRKHAE